MKTRQLLDWKARAEKAEALPRECLDAITEADAYAYQELGSDRAEIAWPCDEEDLALRIRQHLEDHASP